MIKKHACPYILASSDTQQCPLLPAGTRAFFVILFAGFTNSNLGGHSAILKHISMEISQIMGKTYFMRLKRVKNHILSKDNAKSS